jgi:ABC-type glycerol-3-phosphate transport system substrate-binding protein
MVVTDVQSLNKIENAGVNYGVTGSPTAEGVEPWFNVWTDSVGVFANTDHPDEAKLFIAFMATDGQRLRVQETGDLPLDTAVAEELDWAGGTPGREEGLEVLRNARQGVFVPNRWDTFGPIFDAYGLIVGGEMSAQEALDEAAPAIQENLEQAWESWEEQS